MRAAIRFFVVICVLVFLVAYAVFKPSTVLPRRVSSLNNAYSPSPFANVSPVPIGEGISTGAGAGQLAAAVAPIGSATQVVATLIAQPSSVSRGDLFTVSWSSVGMSDDRPCRVSIDGTSLLAEANEGSKQIVAGPATKAGVVTFLLMCTAQSGESIARSASVTVN